MHLEIYDWGGDGSPTLLAHPTGFNGKMWAPVARRLARGGRRVWSFDFRGHGASDRDPSGDYDWQGFVDDVLSVTDSLGIGGDPALVVAGHSMGGATLLGAEVARPGIFARIWTYEPIVPPVDESFSWPADNPMSTRARRRRDVWDSREEAFDTYASKPPLDVFSEDALRGYVDAGLRERPDGRYELTCRPDDEAQIFARSPSPGLHRRLDEIACPVWVVRGAAGFDPPALFAPGIAEGIRHAELVDIEGLGHLGPAQDPRRIVESITEFAART